MSICETFITRRVTTTLMTVAMILCGLLGYYKIPVAFLPPADAPTIVVQARQPGGSPEEIAGTVAAPLEKRLGQIDHITEMTSRSSQNMARITLQFSLDRDINGAARDVEAALQAARADLPHSLRQNPQYWKSNPAGEPILILTLTSDLKTSGQLYDYASNILQQTLATVDGVGEIEIGGSALPAIRVEINPYYLFQYGLSFEDIRAALASANARTPKGTISYAGRQFTLNTNDQIHNAQDYRNLIVAWRSNHPIHLSNIAKVVDDVEDVRRAGFYNGRKSVIVVIMPQVGGNMINTVNRIYKRFPLLKAALPNDTQLNVSLDRSINVRAALEDTKLTLVISVFLVVLVILLFLHSPKTSLIPAIFLPTVLITSIGVLAYLGCSLDLMSLIALTISTGFIADDAIVVIENIARYSEQGLSNRKAAVAGTEEIFFTLISISLSLMAVLLPVLLGSGPAAPIFREFAITLYITIIVSLTLALTLVPMMCTLIMDSHPHKEEAHKMHLWERCFMLLKPFMNMTIVFFEKLQKSYDRSLSTVLDHYKMVVCLVPIFVGFSLVIFHYMPKTLFPESDVGMLMGQIEADQSSSFKSLLHKIEQTQHFITEDPDVSNVSTFAGGSNNANEAHLFLGLKPVTERKDSLYDTMGRITKKISSLPGIRFRLRIPALITIGGRKSNAAYQYTLESENAKELYYWTGKLEEEFKRTPQLQDVSSDAKISAQAVDTQEIRDTQARVNITPQLLSDTLFDAYGQRAASIIYSPLNQYRIVMEAAPYASLTPEVLKQVWISTSGGSAGGGTKSNTIRAKSTKGSDDAGDSPEAKLSQQSFKNMVANSLAGGAGASSGSAVSTGKERMVPLPVITRRKFMHTPLAVNHQGLSAATTVSFNLAPGASLSDATLAIARAKLNIHMPNSINSHFSGGAKEFQKSSKRTPLILIATIITIYITLGVLYESFIHPLTILTTIPPAACGALLALLLMHEPFSLIALIAMMLLMGIVQKNAILLIDFAIKAERTDKLPAPQAIKKACILRFRPIMMTSVAAALGAAPLIFSPGYGAEIRHPLGEIIVGGIIFSQMIILYTTPAFYIAFDQLHQWLGKKLKFDL